MKTGFVLTLAAVGMFGAAVLAAPVGQAPAAAHPAGQTAAALPPLRGALPSADMLAVTEAAAAAAGMGRGR
jgi:hypothetical protein